MIKPIQAKNYIAFSVQKPKLDKRCVSAIIFSTIIIIIIKISNYSIQSAKYSIIKKNEDDYEKNYVIVIIIKKQENCIMSKRLHTYISLFYSTLYFKI